MKITRRELLKTSSTIVAVSFATPFIKYSRPLYGMEEKSPVMMVHHPQATKGLSEVNFNVVKAMLEKALIEFTGEKNLSDAWGKCLPDLLPNDTAVQINQRF